MPTVGKEIESTYLDLVEAALTFSLYDAADERLALPRPIQRRLEATLKRLGLAVVRVRSRHPSNRSEGREWPLFAQTMIGLQRLRSLRSCLEQVIADDVPGDLIEAGVWRGGAAIMMRAVLAARDVQTRKVVVADSFAGVPAPRSVDHLDGKRIKWQRVSQVADSEATVRANFERYGLLDEQVQFVPGWLQETMPALSGRRWALIRLDGDMYSSTIDCLAALYPGLAAAAT
jgi:O-methyltransferase